MATKTKAKTRRSTTSTRRASKKTLSPRQVALTAARQALDEFATSPTRLASLRVVIKDAVFDTLEKLGIDTRDPESTRKDMVHLRTWRELMEFMRQQGVGAAVKWIVTAGLAAVAVGVGVALSKSTG